MNFITASLAGNSFRPANQKTTLPTTARVCLPAELNQLVRQRVTSLIAYTLIDDNQSRKLETLYRLDKVLSQGKYKPNFQVILYGYELSLLYAFLVEQEQQYPCWNVGFISEANGRARRAELRGVLPELRALCRQVDVYADRPIRRQ